MHFLHDFVDVLGRDSVSSPGWPWTLSDVPPSASWVLELVACAIMLCDDFFSMCLMDICLSPLEKYQLGFLPIFFLLFIFKIVCLSFIGLCLSLCGYLFNVYIWCISLYLHLLVRSIVLQGGLISVCQSGLSGSPRETSLPLSVMGVSLCWWGGCTSISFLTQFCVLGDGC